ncbi:MAG: cyclic nucleotide-binding domain-containing protein, partial [Bacteroidota bacterium]
MSAIIDPIAGIASRLKQSFDPWYEAPIEVWEHFASLCEFVSFRKNEIMKEAGAVERSGYFILSGAAGLFVWRDGNCVCLELAFEGEFFADSMSLYTEQVSDVEARAIEDCDMLRISAENIALLKQSEMGRMLFLIAT